MDEQPKWYKARLVKIEKDVRAKKAPCQYTRYSFEVLSEGLFEGQILISAVISEYPEKPVAEEVGAEAKAQIEEAFPAVGATAYIKIWRVHHNGQFFPAVKGYSKKPGNAGEQLANKLEDLAARNNMGFAKSHEADVLRALMAERDEADRRAGAAERRNAVEIAELRDAARKREQWLREAKASRGYDNNVSFARVWAETCAAADSAYTAGFEAAREMAVDEMVKAAPKFGPEGPYSAEAFGEDRGFGSCVQIVRNLSPQQKESSDG